MAVRRSVVVVAALAVLAAAAPAIAGPTPPDDAVHTVRVGSAYASVAADHAEIGDRQISRTWSIGAGMVQTTGLTGPGGTQWAKTGPDFRIDIGSPGTSTDATSSWSLARVRPVRTATAVGIDFSYVLVDPALPSGVTLDREVRLQPGRSAMSVTSTLTSAVVPLRIPSYTLDQITPSKPDLPSEVYAYHEGSDWRNDFRHVSHPSGAFDVEGETLRVGTADGFFLVSQRRGGLASRAEHTAAGADAIGVDWARDLFDAGPLITDPPNYNTLGNPAYPVPVRARVVVPGDSLELGTAWTGTYAGPAGQGANTAAAAFVGAFPFHVDRTIGANSFHPWGHGSGMSDLNLRRQIAVAHQLGIERYMLDDQWQGGPGGESGDWHFDPARFPDRNHDGVPDFVAELHRKGMQLGLWMSPLEFNMHSVTYASHRSWACTPVGDLTAQAPDDAGLGVWDATNPAFQRYLLAVIDRLVAAYDVREFKFDFMAWVDCPPQDYADYEAAFVSLVRRMEQRHPTVTFELDETNDQRAWPFESEALGPSWFDNNHDHHIAQSAELLHDLWSAAPWMPTQTLGIGSFDSDVVAAHTPPTFLMPLALLSHTTFWTDFTKLTPAERLAIAGWDRWYRAHREGIGPLDYELTPADPADGRSWLVLEPWHANSGYIFAFRQNTKIRAIRVQVQGVRPAAHYTVTDVVTGAVVTRCTGESLMRGLRVALPRPYSSRVLAIS